MALSSYTKKKKRKKKMINHNKVVSISQLCFNWAVKTWMLKFKSLKEHKVSCFVDILTFWDLCRVVWWKSPILKFKSQNTTKNACTSAVPCGRRVDGKQCPVLTSRQWTHCISIVPLIVMRPPLLSIETLSFRYAHQDDLAKRQIQLQRQRPFREHATETI